MLYREIIAVCSQIHTKHINKLCGQNVELLNVKPGAIQSNRSAWKGSTRVMLNITILWNVTTCSLVCWREVRS